MRVASSELHLQDNEFLGDSLSADCTVVCCSFWVWEVSVMSAEEGPAGAGQDVGNAEDERLWTVFQGLVDAHGRTRAARVLGVNYRTVVGNLEADRLSRRMRSALQAYQESEASQPGERGAAPEEAKEKPESVPRSAVEESGGDGLTPPQRAHGLPGAGVVTLDPQPDEQHAFGPAAELVAEWRELRTGGTGHGRRVDRVRAEERRWELEILLIEEHGLTLPPERELLGGPRRGERLRWRREALARARRQRVTAERWERLRMVLTLGLWRSR